MDLLSTGAYYVARVGIPRQPLSAAAHHGHVERRRDDRILNKAARYCRGTQLRTAGITRKGYNYVPQRNSPAPDAAARRRISAERIIVRLQLG